MGLYKQLLLGSAAVLTAAAGAQAADLPSRKAAPVEYVKICDVYGAGFFYIPGTDTCLRIGGYVRAEYDYYPGQISSHGSARPLNGAITQIGSGRQDQPPAWKSAAASTSMRARSRPMARCRPSSICAAPIPTVCAPPRPRANFLTNYAPVGNGSSALTMERAYIRFAGFTAGVVVGKLQHDAVLHVFEQLYAGFPNGIKQLAYTATFGGGFSATIAIEVAGDLGLQNRPAPLRQVPSSSVPTAPTTSIETNRLRLHPRRRSPGRSDLGYAQVAGLVGNATTSYHVLRGVL